MLLPYIATHSRKSVERLLISDITAHRVLGFLNHIETERGCTAQTRNQRLSAIRVFTRYVCSRNPACVEWGRQPACHCQQKDPIWTGFVADQRSNRVDLGGAQYPKIQRPSRVRTAAVSLQHRRSCVGGYRIERQQPSIPPWSPSWAKTANCANVRFWPRTEMALLELVDNKLDSAPGVCKLTGTILHPFWSLSVSATVRCRSS